MIIFENDLIMIEEHKKEKTTVYYIIDKSNLNNVKMIIKNF